MATTIRITVFGFMDVLTSLESRDGCQSAPAEAPLLVPPLGVASVGVSAAVNPEQITDEADAQRHPVGQPVPAGPAVVGLLRDLEQVLGADHVADDGPGVLQVVLILA